MIPLYTAPVADAPVDLTNWAAHYSINTAAVEALQSLLAGTPAAPGIDLEQFRESVIQEAARAVDLWMKDEISNEAYVESKAKRDHLLALIDDSRKGGSDGCYFSADPALGEFITHSSLQAAIDSAESMLSDAGDEAHESGWTDDPPQICYGIVLGQCVEVDGSRKPAPEGGEFTEHVEFKLQATSAEVGAVECSTCGDSGEVIGQEGSGPDVYDVTVICPHCSQQPTSHGAGVSE